jgi:hypothetical protein
MGTFIYFVENKDTKGVFRFVKCYRKKGWFRKEKIAYSLSQEDCVSLSDSVVEKVDNCIKKDYPNAQIVHSDKSPVDSGIFETHKFWLIADFSKAKKDKEEQLSYFSYSYKKEVFWTEDLNDAEIYMDKASAERTSNNIRKLVGTSAMVGVKTVYLNLVNELLTPIMMITCTSKSGKKETKYFNRIEGNRLRLVTTSDGAKKFTYPEVEEKFEYLRTHNKNFLYVVWPVFKDNVNYQHLEEYVKKNEISRMLVLTLKLKHFNRKNHNRQEKLETLKDEE